MKFVRFPAAKTGAGYVHFERTVLQPMPVARLRKSMSPQDYATLSLRAKGLPVSVWALALTPGARNLRQWEAIQPESDVAFFYTDKRFSHYAPILFKWRSDLLENLVGWTPRGNGVYYSLAVALGPLTECNLRVNEYIALLGYQRIPMHSEVHTQEDSDELFEALRMNFRVDQALDERGEEDGLDPEGRIKYRLQLLRERSEANRLKVLQQRGHVCEVCAFDFAAQFGAGFAPSAHVHHKNPLALGERRALSLRRVCGSLWALSHGRAHGHRPKTSPVDY